MRTWHPVGVVIGCAVAACFVKPDPPQGAVVDARASDAPAPTDGDDIDATDGSCDRYEMNMTDTGTCGGWANFVTNATVNAGRLTLAAPPSNNSELAACISGNRPFASVTLDITSVTLLTQLDNLRFYVIKDGVSYGVRLYVTADVSTIAIDGECNAVQVSITQPWSTGIGRFVRIRWTSSIEVVVEMSGSLAAPFDTLAICPVAVGSGFPQISLNLVRNGSGSAMSASFESVEICN